MPVSQSVFDGADPIKIECIVITPEKDQTTRDDIPKGPRRKSDIMDIKRYIESDADQDQRQNHVQ
jgi:hypothetical protein